MTASIPLLRESLGRVAGLASDSVTPQKTKQVSKDDASAASTEASSSGSESSFPFMEACGCIDSVDDGPAGQPSSVEENELVSKPTELSPRSKRLRSGERGAIEIVAPEFLLKKQTALTAALKNAVNLTKKEVNKDTDTATRTKEQVDKDSASPSHEKVKVDEDDDPTIMKNQADKKSPSKTKEQVETDDDEAVNTTRPAEKQEKEKSTRFKAPTPTPSESGGSGSGSDSEIDDFAIHDKECKKHHRNGHGKCFNCYQCGDYDDVVDEDVAVERFLDQFTVMDLVEFTCRKCGIVMENAATEIGCIAKVAKQTKETVDKAADLASKQLEASMSLASELYATSFESMGAKILDNQVAVPDSMPDREQNIDFDKKSAHDSASTNDHPEQEPDSRDDAAPSAPKDTQGPGERDISVRKDLEECADRHEVSVGDVADETKHLRMKKRSERLLRKIKKSSKSVSSKSKKKVAGLVGKSNNPQDESKVAEPESSNPQDDNEPKLDNLKIQDMQQESDVEPKIQGSLSVEDILADIQIAQKESGSVGRPEPSQKEHPTEIPSTQSNPLKQEAGITDIGDSCLNASVDDEPAEDTAGELNAGCRVWEPVYDAMQEPDTNDSVEDPEQSDGENMHVVSIPSLEPASLPTQTEQAPDVQEDATPAAGDVALPQTTHSESPKVSADDSQKESEQDSDGKEMTLDGNSITELKQEKESKGPECIEHSARDDTLTETKHDDIVEENVEHDAVEGKNLTKKKRGGKFFRQMKKSSLNIKTKTRVAGLYVKLSPRAKSTADKDADLESSKPQDDDKQNDSEEILQVEGEHEDEQVSPAELPSRESIVSKEEAGVIDISDSLVNSTDDDLAEGTANEMNIGCRMCEPMFRTMQEQGSDDIVEDPEPFDGAKAHLEELTHTMHPQKDDNLSTYGWEINALIEESISVESAVGGQFGAFTGPELDANATESDAASKFPKDGSEHQRVSPLNEVTKEEHSQRKESPVQDISDTSSNRSTPSNKMMPTEELITSSTSRRSPVSSEGKDHSQRKESPVQDISDASSNRSTPSNKMMPTKELIASSTSRESPVSSEEKDQESPVQEISDTSSNKSTPSNKMVPTKQSMSEGNFHDDFAFLTAKYENEINALVEEVLLTESVEELVVPSVTPSNEVTTSYQSQKKEDSVKEIPQASSGRSVASNTSSQDKKSITPKPSRDVSEPAEEIIHQGSYLEKYENEINALIEETLVESVGFIHVPLPQMGDTSPNASHNENEGSVNDSANKASVIVDSGAEEGSKASIGNEAELERSAQDETQGITIDEGRDDIASQSEQRHKDISTENQELFATQEVDPDTDKVDEGRSSPETNHSESPLTLGKERSAGAPLKKESQEEGRNSPASSHCESTNNQESINSCEMAVNKEAVQGGGLKKEIEQDNEHPHDCEESKGIIEENKSPSNSGVSATTSINGAALDVDEQIKIAMPPEMASECKESVKGKKKWPRLSVTKTRNKGASKTNNQDPNNSPSNSTSSGKGKIKKTKGLMRRLRSVKE